MGGARRHLERVALTADNETTTAPPTSGERQAERCPTPEELVLREEERRKRTLAAYERGVQNARAAGDRPPRGRKLGPGLWRRCR